MKTTSDPQSLNPQEAQLLRFMDGLEPSSQAEWLAEKAAADQLGTLLRSQMPSRLEPPSAEFFTSQIMEQITPAVRLQAVPAAQEGFLQRFRYWFAPLATAAAVLVVGSVVLNRHSEASTRNSFTYTPLPNVTATLAENEAAGATVIMLNGLDPIPNETEIRPFNVASSTKSADRHNVEPGAPQQFFAANDPGKLLFVLFPNEESGPSIQEMH